MGIGRASSATKGAAMVAERPLTLVTPMTSPRKAVGKYSTVLK
eukprot:CAMPEP_0170481762 /NCGR_PEP_ID=MMETSP0208-20121228/2079_1 /TAXON_ID=197538 /ORGANISM="Strombidium inclinatum, Strain S3" /LENGTH=42 /DNA_ID= /DNA_START= /DNA_END= /DNA_ORIENTATION=